MTNRSTPRPAAGRSALESPWLAGALAIAVLALAAILIVPGLLAPSGPGPSQSGVPASSQPSPSASLAAPTFVRPTPSPIPTFTSYVVKAGDTLNSIATQFDTSARSIAWWNRGTYSSLDPESDGYNPDRLDIGWTLALIPHTIVDDTNPPGPSPSAAPTAGQPTARPTARPTPAATTSGGLATVISNGSRSKPQIALTFDMGGRLDPAVAIVQWLIDHDVHATLFPTGKSTTQTVQGLQAMQLAATRPDLFDFGNHSWDHPDFRDLSAAQMAEQLTSAEAALADIVGSTKPWFRPPFGGWNSDVRAAVGAAGWQSMMMWDVDMIDWRPEADGGPTAADMEAKLRAKAQGGSIVLMHLGGFNTLEALPGLLDACSDLGLQPVTLDEMLGG